MPLMCVEVPAGLYSGDPFTVEAAGQCFEITVPDGVAAGELIEVDLPVDEMQTLTLTAEQDFAPPLLVEIAVPDGTGPGFEINVEHDGQVFSVVVPDGLFPGDVFTVEVPAAKPAPTEMEGEPTGQQRDRSLTTPPLLPDEMPAAANEIASRYLVECDRAGEARGSTSVGPYPFHTEGSYDLLQLVQVYRSDGSWTPATVLTYDERADTYDVEVEGGQVKYMVETDCLQFIELGSFAKHQAVQVREGGVWVWARIDDFFKDASVGIFGSFVVIVELFDARKRRYAWSEWCTSSRSVSKPKLPEIWEYEWATGEDEDMLMRS